jgi:hypothetical protein
MHRIAIILAMMAQFGAASSVRAQNPMSYASVQLEGSCGDGLNGRVFLRNRHSTNDIMATVRWRVANGLYTTNQFRANAGSQQQIGCASDARLTAARFLNAPENAMPFVSIRFEGSCGDGLNSRVFLINRHGSRGIQATVRWRVANGQFSTDGFRINAGMRVQIGCANQANLTAAGFVN